MAVDLSYGPDCEPEFQEKLSTFVSHVTAAISEATIRDNPFLRLQAERLAGRRGERRGFRAAMSDTFDRSRRPSTEAWMAAWQRTFGQDFAGYSAGLDAWFPMRDEMTAEGFIERFITPETPRVRL
jgi:hypothetical protein